MLRDAIAAIRQFAAFAFFFKVFGFFDDDTRQGQQCNQVRNRHQAIEGICRCPHQIQARYRTHHHRGHINHAVRGDAFVAKQVSRAFFTVVTPAQNG